MMDPSGEELLELGDDQVDPSEESGARAEEQE